MLNLSRLTEPSTASLCSSRAVPIGRRACRRWTVVRGGSIARAVPSFVAIFRVQLPAASVPLRQRSHTPPYLLAIKAMSSILSLMMAMQHHAMDDRCCDFRRALPAVLRIIRTKLDAAL